MRDRFVAGFAEAAARPGWALTYTSNEIARFVRPGGAGAEHWLTLDVSVRAYGLRLNPVLSVRHVEVAELAGRMLGRGGDAAQAGKALADLVRADGRPADAERNQNKCRRFH